MRLTAVWASLLLVVVAALLGPVTARADENGLPKPQEKADAATVYEVAEWGTFIGTDPSRRRQATATLVGTVEAGATICPKKLKVPFCNLTISATDDISLTTGLGPVQGEFWVVVQLDNPVDGPEGVVLAGELFDGTIDLRPALFDQVPIGFLSGQWEAKGAKGGPLDGWTGEGKVTGIFQLPFVIPGLIDVPSYVVDPALFPNNGCCQAIQVDETSLGTFTVRLKLSLTRSK